METLLDISGSVLMYTVGAYFCGALTYLASIFVVMWLQDPNIQNSNKNNQDPFARSMWDRVFPDTSFKGLLKTTFVGACILGFMFSRH